jgi:peroxiredoxin
VQADILKPLYDEYRRSGVEFLAISVGEEEEQVREFVERRPYPYPVLVDPEDEVSAELGIIVLPTLMILDRAGEVTYFEPGIADAATVRRLLQEAGA